MPAKYTSWTDENWRTQACIYPFLNHVLNPQSAIFTIDTAMNI